MDSGESLGIYLQTIRTLMNSRLYQQQDSQNKNELEIQEEEQFLNQLQESLIDLQERLRSDMKETEEGYEEKKEKHNELLSQLSQEAEILEQQNQELKKVLQNEEEQHMAMTQQLAKSQLENFQNSQLLQELDNQFYEGNKYKIKTDEINMQNKLMKEKKLQLLNEEKVYKSQIEDQHSLIKKLHKDHLQIEAQYRMFERKLIKLRKDQEEQMQANSKSKQGVSQMQTQCRNLIEQNQALMAQMDCLQFQIEESGQDHDHNMILPISHLQQNGIPLPHNDNHDHPPSRQSYKGSSGNYDHIVTSLKDELGDQFSESFFSPISSVTETDRDREDGHLNGYSKNNRYHINPQPFLLDDERRQTTYYESSGGTTEQSSTNTRSSDLPPNPKTIALNNPIKHLNKVMLASDFENQDMDEVIIHQGTDDTLQDEVADTPKQDNSFYMTMPSGYIGNGSTKNKNSNHSRNSSFPAKLNNQNISQICSNIISFLTYKPLMQFKNNQLLSLKQQ